jgi:hypothetical protein
LLGSTAHVKLLFFAFEGVSAHEFVADVEDAAQFDQLQLAPHMRRGIVLPVVIFLTSLIVYLAATTSAVLD